MPLRRRLGLVLLFVETLGDLLGVSLVVELEEPGEDFPTSRFANREPGALLSLVEAVAEVEVRPVISDGNLFIHLHVEVTEPLNERRRFIGIMEAVVEAG